MDNQEIVSQAEVEWYSRLRGFETIIFDNRRDELESRYNQLRAIWDVVTNKWYLDYNNQDDSSETNLSDWLEYLRNTGGIPISYPTWREQHKTIVAAMSDGNDLETSIRVACVAPRLASVFEENRVLQITSPDGDRTLKTGEPVVITYTNDDDKAHNGQTFGEYAETISKMPSSRHASDTIKHDLKMDSVNVSNMWEGEAVTDATFRNFWGEMMVHTENGDTPYQFKFSVEKAMPVTAQRIALRRLSQRYAYLAMEHGKGE